MPGHTQFACLALAAMLLMASTADALKKGDGTAYSDEGEKNKTGFNSCQFGKLSARWERYYGALPSHIFDREKHCGKCVRIRGAEKDAPDGWVVVKIVDECASCKGDWDIDLSIPALDKATGYEWDRKTIQWEWCSCSAGSNRKLAM